MSEKGKHESEIASAVQAALNGHARPRPGANAARKVADRRPRKARPEQSHKWLQDCSLDDKGRPYPNFANVLHALRCDPLLSDVFGYDEMSGAVMVMQPLPDPVTGGVLPEDDWRPHERTENCLLKLLEYLQVIAFPRLSKSDLHDAIEARANQRSFHPVRDFLNELTWDGVPRVSFWMHTYLGAEKNRYATVIGRMFLIAMVARIFKPGCKADHMVVLEGPQGAMKSTVCKILGGEWFSDSMPDITAGKDVQVHLRGKWLIELAEMSPISKAEDSALKAFLSRSEERFRPPYGRVEITLPRQCVFIGTTNQSVYLRDETGGRRFWPVKVGQIDANSLIRDREQLLAEALHLYRDGEHWWPSADLERECIKPEQEARFEGDPWEPAIAHYIVGKSRATTEEIRIEAIGLGLDKTSSREGRRIASIMRRLGWKSRHIKSGTLYEPIEPQEG